MKSKVSRNKINYKKKKSLLNKFKHKGGDCNREGINHPWAFYPRGALGSYPFYDRYRNETIRLIEFMKHLQTEENIYHLNFIIGSPLEDPHVTDDKGTQYYQDIQWQQMIPYHIQQLLLELYKTGSKLKYIQIVVISPDDFINDSYSPLFLTKSLYRSNARKTGLLQWGIQLNKIKINFFNCPVPNIEQRENVKRLKLDESLQSTYKISSYVSNDIDIECIGLFYQLLSNLCEKKISIAINSWAVFRVNDFGFHETIKNYSMFPELLAIAKKYNIIATEWYWSDYDNNIIHDLVNDVYYIYTRPRRFGEETEYPRLILPIPYI